MSAHFAYRREVDGLRAIAVVPVVLYHAGLPGFGGGFVGVDVFFVISGFLITGLMCRELVATGRISLASFFERRVRRLAPALLLVLAATLVLGAVYLSPIGGEQQGLARSAIAALALSANLYFWNFTGGYFDDPAEGQPLLHLWSLAVEEQFYLVWPWLLLGLFALAQRHSWRWRGLLAVGLSVVTAASLVLCIVWSRHDAHDAFYLTPARAWELAVGGLAFLLVERLQTLQQLPPRVAVGLALLGLAAIVAAVVGLDRSLVYPGTWALIPVLGTAAVLVGTAVSPQGLVTRLLALRPLVAIGLVSYAWYLWHWPLLVVARAENLGALPLGRALTMVAVSLALAALTYCYMELPIRSRRFRLMADRSGAWRTAGAGYILVLVMGAGLGIWSKWAWHALPGNGPLAQALGDMRKVRVPCGAVPPYTGPLVSNPACDRGELLASDGPRLLVWGDSHAAHLVPLLESHATRSGTKFRVRYMPQCPPTIGFSPSSIGLKNVEGCIDFNRDVLEEIKRLHNDGTLEAVVLNARWTGYAWNAEGLQGITEGLDRTLQGLHTIGVRTVLFMPSPDMPYEVPACLVRRPAGVCDLQHSVGEDARSALLQVMRRLADLPSVRTFDPFTALCTKDVCPAIMNGKVIYSDSHHLTEAGSRTLLEIVSATLDWAIDDEPRFQQESGVRTSDFKVAQDATSPSL